MGQLPCLFGMVKVAEDALEILLNTYFPLPLFLGLNCGFLSRFSPFAQELCKFLC
jgi:hypothetical protein